MKYIKIDIIGKIPTAAGDIEKISTCWRLLDYLGMIAVRLDINRMNYAIAPGLYAVGAPAKDSPVLVSCNYKLSFDVLRRELAGLNLWILVIDTKGVNVWCAAGKGTFGTKEIINRVIVTRLAEIVTTRKLILPQLGAPGVFGHMVEPFCDFNVIYGPIRAKDIKKFLSNGMKADNKMRLVTFNLAERMEVVWLELANAAKQGIIVSVVLLLLNFWFNTHLLLLMFWVGVLTGTVLAAALLPWLPGRAFSFKGGFLGVVVGLFFAYGLNIYVSLALILFIAAISAYLTLNYTGCSTFTSVAGVKKEVRIALPIIGLMLLVSIALYFTGRA